MHFFNLQFMHHFGEFYNHFKPYNLDHLILQIQKFLWLLLLLNKKIQIPRIILGLKLDDYKGVLKKKMALVREILFRFRLFIINPLIKN